LAITLGSLTFDENLTSFSEQYEEVAGRDERVVVVKGSIPGVSTVAAAEAALDAILDEASVEDYSAALSLRDARRLFVRRDAFERQVLRSPVCAAFTLRLRARDPFEESEAETQTAWPIAASGATLNVSASGNVYSPAVITLAASGTLVEPAVSDGVNVIAYSGTVVDGETLVFDGVAQRVTLEGTDVTPYASGTFPRIDPAGTTLTYTDHPASSHTAAGTVAFRDRWW
jgi:hypothetical protein